MLLWIHKLNCHKPLSSKLICYATNNIRDKKLVQTKCVFWFLKYNQKGATNTHLYFHGRVVTLLPLADIALRGTNPDRIGAVSYTHLTLPTKRIV